MKPYRISFAGAGRVASSLCRRLSESGFKIDLIVSPSEEKGRQLAVECKASWSPDLSFPYSTDIVIVAVSDKVLGTVLGNVRCKPEALIVHTAGSFGTDLFPESISNKGVFYPLQTFSAGREIDYKDLPFLLEASDRQSSDILVELVAAIGGRASFVNTDQRILIHLAAVFICNFSNHMLALGKQISDKAGVPFDIFYPLLKETVSKAIELGPEESQTGPAIRKDKITIEKHLELLSFSPELQKLYNEISMSIININNKL
jgi:predicted short-subunit dehydrogenase-like oxidoreductase (DUF2520 family)